MPARPLVATYRVQLRNGVTLDDVADPAVLDDLAALGISHLYLSPILTAVEGSTHGYDVVDHSSVDPALGGDEALRRLAEAAHARGLGLVVDIVPNHMAVDHRQNAWWWDLLRHGPSSRYAPAFDIDWEPPEVRFQGLVTLPVLPDHLGREIERGAFELAVADGEVVARHPSTIVPLEPASIGPTLGRAAGRCEGAAQDGMLALAADLWDLPPFDGADPAARRRRQDEAPDLRARFAELVADPSAHAAVTAELAELAQDPDRLDELLLRQPYRLLRWQAGVQDLAYRRFFDVTGLVALRMDRPEVFDLAHAATLEWVANGWVDGLRVDHPDGLRDPEAYFRALRAAAPDAWLVAEKILEPGERLRAEWGTDGTTGYDVAELVGRLHLDDRGRHPLTSLAAESGIATDVRATVISSTAQVLDDVLVADLARVSNILLTVCQRQRRFRDFTRWELHHALREVVARFDVYRSYVRPGTEAGAEDRLVIEAALDDARDARPDLDPELFTLLDALLCDVGPTTGPEAELRWRLQQLTGPAKAKGKEDTAWYRLVALLHRVEVGSDADAWELPLDRFHDEMAFRQEHWPLAMTGLSTHDSKRSEDVRARLAVLTELPDEWVALVERWREHLGRPAALTAPDATAELVLLQSLVGAHPLSVERALEFALKAAREAKVRTSWLEPDAEYEDHLERYVRSVMADPWVTAALDRFDEVIRLAGRRVALAQKAVQLPVPGVPDLYQGSEQWLLRLVDPDNRGGFDHQALHDAALTPTDFGSASELDTALEDPTDSGTPKAAVVRRALDLRRRHPEAFGPEGSYEPVWAAGPSADHVVAYRRGEDVVVVSARKMLGLTDGWRDTYLDLPPGRWHDGACRTIDGGRVELDALLGTLPVVMLERAEQ